MKEILKIKLVKPQVELHNGFVVIMLVPTVLRFLRKLSKDLDLQPPFWNV